MTPDGWEVGRWAMLSEGDGGRSRGWRSSQGQIRQEAAMQSRECRFYSKNDGEEPEGLRAGEWHGVTHISASSA